MKIYLSYGAGVVSEALRLWLLENEYDFEAVWVDHGCDWPETIEFAHTIPNLTILKPNVEGYDNLYDYCLKYKMVPHFKLRFCTVKFKLQTLYNYFKKPSIVYIGYTIDEENRMRQSQHKNIINCFPFLMLNWTRKNCIDYIKKLDKKVPIRSGCWFCPFQTKEQWKLLMKQHPDLYIKAKELEKLNIEYRKSKGKDPLTLHASGKSLEILTQERQMELFKA